MTTPAPHVTQILTAVRNHEPGAAEQLLPRVYEELRGIAGHLFRGSGPPTLQPTALVHEAYLRLIGSERGWQDRAHFIAVAAIAMRQILANYVREKRAAKRGGAWQRVALESAEQKDTVNGVDLMVLHDALERLAALNARQARIVELRVLGGLTLEEVAAVLDLGLTTIKRDWLIGRAWLKRALLDPEPA